MPRRDRPQLDVILRVPRHEPYTDKRSAAAARRESIHGADGATSAAGAGGASDGPPEPPIASPSSTSSAEWNSLLIWARRMRGPQWDSGVGLWMVDRGGDEYYSFCSDPTQSVTQPTQNGPSGPLGQSSTTSAYPAVQAQATSPDAMPAFEGGVAASTGSMSPSANGRLPLAASSQQPHQTPHPLANEVVLPGRQQQQQQQQGDEGLPHHGMPSHGLHS